VRARQASPDVEWKLIASENQIRQLDKTWAAERLDMPTPS